MAGQTNVGTQTLLSAEVPVTDTIALYSALTWTQVTLVTELGEFGGEADSSDYSPMATGAKVKLAGTIDYNSISINMPDDVEEAGQILAQDLFDGDVNGGTECSLQLLSKQGNAIFIRGVITSFKTNYGSTGDVVSASFDFEVNAKPVRATAAELAAV